jgi:hypothetical protein
VPVAASICRVNSSPNGLKIAVIQVVSVEWLAAAPAPRLTPRPGWIAAGLFAPPFLGRKRPTVTIFLLNLLVSELFSLGDVTVELGDQGSLQALSPTLRHRAFYTLLPQFFFYLRRYHPLAGLAFQSSLSILAL